jgi:flavin-dependent dehydrogenase
MMQKLYETVVIGGGPAGCAAAITLANAGKPVCLLERKTTPHDKVCGEFLSYDSVQTLFRLGVDLEALGGQLINQLVLHNGTQTLECELPFPGWSLSRRVLDAHLLEKAEAAGAQILSGRTVRNFNRSHHFWDLLVTEQNETKARQTTLIQAKNLFLATGKHEIQDWKRREIGADSDILIGIKMHFRLSDEQLAEIKQRVEIYFYNGGYAGLVPIGNDKVNLCFLIKKDVYKTCKGDWNTILDWLCMVAPLLKKRLQNGYSLWSKPLAVSGVPYGYVQPIASSNTQLFRLGDQAGVIHSLAGDGIAIALQSAVLAAESFITNAGSSSYQKHFKQQYSRPIKQAQLLATFLSTGGGRKISFAIARQWPGLIAKIVSFFRLSEKRVSEIATTDFSKTVAFSKKE